MLSSVHVCMSATVDPLPSGQFAEAFDGDGRVNGPRVVGFALNDSLLATDAGSHAPNRSCSHRLVEASRCCVVWLAAITHATSPFDSCRAPGRLNRMVVTTLNASKFDHINSFQQPLNARLIVIRQRKREARVTRLQPGTTDPTLTPAPTHDPDPDARTEKEKRGKWKSKDNHRTSSLSGHGPRQGSHGPYHRQRPMDTCLSKLMAEKTELAHASDTPAFTQLCFQPPVACLCGFCCACVCS